MIAVREFNNAADYLAHVAAVRARLFAPRTKPAPIGAAHPDPDVKPAPLEFAAVYDAHVMAWRKTQRSVPRLSEILAAVCSVYGVSKDDICSESRRVFINRPRQVAMYLMRQDTKRSLPQIGGVLGGRDHTTILSGIRKIERLLAEGRDLKLPAEIAACRAVYQLGDANG